LILILDSKIQYFHYLFYNSLIAQRIPGEGKKMINRSEETLFKEALLSLNVLERQVELQKIYIEMLQKGNCDREETVRKLSELSVDTLCQAGIEYALIDSFMVSERKAKQEAK